LSHDDNEGISLRHEFSWFRGAQATALIMGKPGSVVQALSPSG
jgi:hypothetical protein